MTTTPPFPRKRAASDSRMAVQSSDFVRLGDVAEIISKGTTPTSVGLKFSPSGIPFVRGENVLGTGVDLSNISMFIDADADAKLARSSLKKGDVLVTIAGTIGRIGFIATDDGANCNQAVAFVRCLSDLIDAEWLCLLLQSPAYQSQFAEFVAGGAIPNVSLTQIGSLLIPNVQITEQRRIAARLKAQLAEVDTARQAAQAQVREAEALRASIYRDAFRQVVPVAVPPHFKDAPDGWQWHKLADIARLESGHTPSRHRPDWWGGDVSWISLTEIRALDGQWVESTQLRTNAEGIANSSARILPRGTVCYSRTASVGFVCIMAQPMATSQDFANWVCGDELEPEFLMHALIRCRKELRDIATGATHKTIYMPQLESFHLCSPDIDEQRRIVARLKAQLAQADAIAQAAAAQLAEVERLPQRLLAQAFNPPSTSQGEVK